MKKEEKEPFGNENISYKELLQMVLFPLSSYGL
jgi:hypothetical protein